jgi:hypothetical protein
VTREKKAAPPPTAAERRANQPLREALDEFLEHARMLVRRTRDMSPAELEYAQQRLEWLADEVWRQASGRPSPP